MNYLRFNFNNDSSNFAFHSFFFFFEIFRYSSINECESYIWKKIHRDTIKLLSIKNISVTNFK